jgi:flagellar hook-length control protein FliK
VNEQRSSEPRPQSACGILEPECHPHRTTDSVVMPLATLASLTSALASSAVHVAGHAADAASAKATAVKPASKGKTPSDATTLANAFAACLAAASTATPVVPLPTPQLTLPVHLVSRTSAPAIAAVGLGADHPAANNASSPGVRPPLVATTAKLPPPASAGKPSPSASPTVTPSPDVMAAAAQQKRGASSPTTPGTPTAANVQPKPLSSEGKGDGHLGIHTTAETATPETVPPDRAPTTTKDAPLAESQKMTGAATAAKAVPPPLAKAENTAPPVIEPAANAAGLATDHSPANAAGSPTVTTTAVRVSEVVPKSAGRTPAHPSSTDTHSATNSPTATPLDASNAVNLAAPAANIAVSSGIAPTNAPVADQLTRAVLAQADVVQREGRTDFHLRLDPPQLGSVQIHLTATQHSVSARIVVAQEGTRQLLQDQAHHLRQGLAEAGLSLGSFDVAHDGGGSRGGNQQAPPEPALFLRSAGSSPRTAAIVSTVSAPVSRPKDGIDIIA